MAISKIPAGVLSCLACASRRPVYAGAYPSFTVSWPPSSHSVVPIGKGANRGDAVYQLAKLADLLEKNPITREEFDRLKCEVLGASQ